jgi:hypothetical protein
MGFMDKAKKLAEQAQEKGLVDKAKQMAEQAQTKLDDAQSKFNESQGQGQQPSPGPVTEYDKHGRPVGGTAPAAAPSGPSPAEEGIPDAATSEAAPPAEAEAPAPPVAPPAAPAAGPTGDLGAAESDRDDEYAPPKMSSGDPLG